MNSKSRFSGKAENYAKYRPQYPVAFIRYLIDEVGFSEESIVADVGAGTGIFTKQISDHVKTVYAVEPNADMRNACKVFCNDKPNVVIIDGCAEETTLPDNSIDYITAAQAFHWFDRDNAKAEFQRILKPSGNVILVWNKWVTDCEFAREYDELLSRHCLEFKGFAGGISEEAEVYDWFFKDGICDYRIFNNDKSETLGKFIGGSLSASYAPTENDEGYESFVTGLKELFMKYSDGNLLIMPNKTYSYKGRI